MEKVTGVALVGKSEEITEKLENLFREDFDFFVDAFPFSSRVSAEDKRMSFDDSKSPECYVENGFVLPDGMESVSFSAKVRGAYLTGDRVDVELYPNKDIPGLYYVSVDGTYEDGVKADNNYVAFLDGKKIAKATGLPFEEVERGEVDRKGNFTVTESKVRPDAVRTVEKAEVKPEPKIAKEPKKSVMEQNLEAGFPDRIKDMGTGFNRVYMKTFAGDFDKLNHAALFPRDPNTACPVLADSRVNLGEMTLLAVSVRSRGGQADVGMYYAPAVLEMNLQNYENDFTAYGPALAKSAVPGQDKEGDVFYMDVTGLDKKTLKKMEASIRQTVNTYNTERDRSKKLEDIILKDMMARGAKSPVLALGKEFDNIVREYEAREIRAKEEAEIRREQAEMELEAKNAAIKEEVRNKRRSGQYIEPERRDLIFVHKPVMVKPEHGPAQMISLLEPPDKEKGEDYYKIKCKVGYRDMEIRVPKASKELGRDGKPLSFVKKVKNQFSEVGYVINVSHRLGKQFPAYCNGMPTGTSVGYSELYSFMEIKNQELRNLSGERTVKDRESNQDLRQDVGFHEDRQTRTEARRSLRPRYKDRSGNGNHGYGDGM